MGGSFAYVFAGAKQALIGTFIFALTSCAGHFIREQQPFGEFSAPITVCLIGGMGVSWLAMALRQGLDMPNPPYGLQFGRDELNLGLSVFGFLFVMGIISFLVGFLVFLLIMMIAAIGGGAFTGADVASAPIFETPEAFRAFLRDTRSGQVIGAVGIFILVSAVLFLFWLALRLSPFPAAAVAKRRFVVLQAMAWTRYKDKALMLAGLPIIGIAFAFIFIGRSAVFMLPLFPVIAVLLAHMLTCFCLLIIVGFICEIYRQTAR